MRIDPHMMELFRSFTADDGKVQEDEAWVLTEEASDENVASSGCCRSGTRGNKSLKGLLAQHPDAFSPAAKESIEEWLYPGRFVEVEPPSPVPHFGDNPGFVAPGVISGGGAWGGGGDGFEFGGGFHNRGAWDSFSGGRGPSRINGGGRRNRMGSGGSVASGGSGRENRADRPNSPRPGNPGRGNRAGRPDTPMPNTPGRGNRPNRPVSPPSPPASRPAAPPSRPTPQPSSPAPGGGRHSTPVRLPSGSPGTSHGVGSGGRHEVSPRNPARSEPARSAPARSAPARRESGGSGRRGSRS